MNIGKKGENSAFGIHEMRLDEEPFNMIKNRWKTVEIRLCDEKREKIKPGDFIRFELRGSDDVILVRVNSLYRTKDFATLFEVGGILEKCGWRGIDLSAAVEKMRLYYTYKDEEKYGALGIEFAVITDSPIETPIVAI